MLHDHQRLTAGFFRGVNDKSLFKEFFDKYGAWDELGLKEKPTNDDIHSAWRILDLTHPKKAAIREKLSQMNDLAREDAREWLYTVSDEVKVPDYKNLTLHKMSMILFLRHPRAFKRAYECFSVEKLDNLKVFVGDPVPCSPAEEDLDRFCGRLRTTLKKSGQGPKLMVEPGPEVEGKLVLVIPHENHVKPDFEFESETKIVTRDRRPIYEMVIIYYPDHGVLKMKTGRSKGKAGTVSALFSSQLLGKPEDHFRAEDIVKFDPLFQPGFDFPKEPGDHFDWAVPSFIDFKPKARSALRHIITFDCMRGGKYNILEQLETLGFTLDSIDILALGIHFRFPDAGRRSHRTVILTPPARYNLDETPRSRHLEDVLIRWGFLNVRALAVVG